jgi:hypothetical protein
MKKAVVLSLIFLFSLSCKSTKVKVAEVDYMPARVIVKKNRDAAFPAERLRATLAIKYRGSKEMPNISASLRMVKDSIIWINFSKLGFPIAKLRITPRQVEFYEKISKTSFRGDFKLISEWLGTDFDFLKVQNLFLGESLLNLTKGKYVSSVVKNQYELQPKRRNPMYDIYFWIDPTNYKIVKEELRHPEKDQNLTILYKDFNKISESLFPKGFLITAAGQQKKTVIDVSYKNVQLDVPMRFPFQMPEGYRNIELE